METWLNRELPEEWPQVKPPSVTRAPQDGPDNGNLSVVRHLDSTVAIQQGAAHTPEWRRILRPSRSQSGKYEDTKLEQMFEEPETHFQSTPASVKQARPQVSVQNARSAASDDTTMSDISPETDSGEFTNVDAGRRLKVFGQADTYTNERLDGLLSSLGQGNPSHRSANENVHPGMGAGVNPEDLEAEGALVRKNLAFAPQKPERQPVVEGTSLEDLERVLARDMDTTASSNPDSRYMKSAHASNGSTLSEVNASDFETTASDRTREQKHSWPKTPAPRASVAFARRMQSYASAISNAGQADCCTNIDKSVADIESLAISTNGASTDEFALERPPSIENVDGNQSVCETTDSGLLAKMPVQPRTTRSAPDTLNWEAHADTIVQKKPPRYVKKADASKQVGRSFDPAAPAAPMAPKPAESKANCVASGKFRPRPSHNNTPIYHKAVPAAWNDTLHHAVFDLSEARHSFESNIPEQVLPLHFDTSLQTKCGDMTFSQNMRELERAIPESMTNNECLNLSGHGFESIVGVADYAPNVWDLDLSSNKLRVLEGLPPRTTRLCLANNLLDHTTMIPPAPIVDLDVSHNNIPNFNGFALLRQVVRLTASHNPIKSLSGLEHLPFLERLDLGNCALESVEIDSPNITFFSAENNPLRRCILNSSSLETLNINGCNASLVIRACPNLSRLFISGCHVVSGLESARPCELEWMHSSRLQGFTPQVLSNALHVTLGQIDVDALAPSGYNDSHILYPTETLHLALCGKSLPEWFAMIFPCLRKLYITKIDEPSRAVLARLPSLEELVIDNERVSLRRLAAETHVVPGRPFLATRVHTEYSLWDHPMLQADYWKNNPRMQRIVKSFPEVIIAALASREVVHARARLEAASDREKAECERKLLVAEAQQQAVSRTLHTLKA